jgi:protoheme IX farnesyltransferase
MNSIRAYIELTKPRLGSMVLITAALGYFLAAGGIPRPLVLFFTLLGGGLATGGASVLNQYLERDYDARMERTRRRPIPAGRVSPQRALSFGTLFVLCGCFLLVWQVNLLTAFLTLLSAFLYVVVYTPMKRLSWLNTSIGAIPGALPPLIGWAAATGSVGLGGWVVFAILYLWQHPHFFAIAWMYRHDYAKAGFKMLPVVYPGGLSTVVQVLFFSVLLVPVSLLPTFLGMTGWVYFTGVLALGIGMLAAGVIFARERSHAAARRVLRASLIYLPVQFLLIIVDRSV